MNLSSSDEFSVATPDETAGKESEFRCCEFKKYNYLLENSSRDSP